MTLGALAPRVIVFANDRMDIKTIIFIAAYQ